MRKEEQSEGRPGLRGIRGVWLWSLLAGVTLLVAMWWIVLLPPSTWRIYGGEATRLERLEQIARIVTPVAVLIGIYVAWRRAVAADRQAAAALRSVETAQEGQITERFTRAVEQLGGDPLAIRLGGIYALERIARDSVKDHWTVMEVLSAYVRDTSRAPVEEHEKEGVTPDIHAILKVLARRQAEADPENQVLSLRGAYLSGAHLDGAKLGRAYLFGANIAGGVLREADLHGSWLSAANLSGADFSGADLSGADLSGANLSGANLSGANLSGANLRGSLNLTHKQVYAARGDDQTKLPPELESPEHWFKK